MNAKYCYGKAALIQSPGALLSFVDMLKFLGSVSGLLMVWPLFCKHQQIHLYSAGSDWEYMNGKHFADVFLMQVLLPCQYWQECSQAVLVEQPPCLISPAGG